jgi:hypothetical protein
LECQKCLLLVDVVTILVNPEDPRSNDKDNCIKYNVMWTGTGCPIT